MPIGRDDIVRALAGERIEIPPALFTIPAKRDKFTRDDPELRRAVDWLKSYLSPGDWIVRRDAAFVRLMAAAYQIPTGDGKGRFYDVTDSFGWYLFLADALLDHPFNYEPIYGSRVVPVLKAIGRDLDLISSINGVDERVRRLIDSERRQPNGGFFELLVAAAYRREGANVSFRPELPGVARTYDLDVTIGGMDYAVECKRFEVSEYGDRERERIRRVWGPAALLAQRAERSVYANVEFLVPVFDVPDDYLIGRVHAYLNEETPAQLWADSIGRGIVGELDLRPLQAVLRDNDLLSASTRVLELLNGIYVRGANYVSSLRIEQGFSPLFIGKCNLAILLRWQTLSAAAIDAKARDVTKRLSEASSQLSSEKPGIIHLGIETVEGDAVEEARFAKIQARIDAFDPKGKPLNFVYSHFLYPESPPDVRWRFDETTNTKWIGGPKKPPLQRPFLVLSADAASWPGAHWDGTGRGG